MGIGGYPLESDLYIWLFTYGETNRNLTYYMANNSNTTIDYNGYWVSYRVL